MKISIFGIGYVGAVSLACMARDGHSVIGIDVDQAKLDLLTAGKSPVAEEGMDDLVRSGIAGGRVQVTTDAGAAVLGSEVSFVCVGTPSAPGGGQDQRAVLHTAEQLGATLAAKTEPHVVVFRSTLAPGTLEGSIRPIIERASGKRDGKDFFLCVQPEFLREGSSIHDYDEPPFTIVGASSPYAVDKLRELFGHLPCRFLPVSVRTAEIMKLACNNFHALKIAFANETARLSAAVGADAFEVMDLLCQDTQLNISRAYLEPGFAFGGSCLPKDLRATTHLAGQRGVKIPVLDSILASNQEQVALAFDRIIATGRRRVGFLGLSFKAGTDDLRESPLVVLAERLLDQGLQLAIHDAAVYGSQLLGANGRYVAQHLPRLAELLRSDAATVIAESEVLVASRVDAEVVQALIEGAGPDKLVLELTRLPGRERIAALVEGLCW